jgi:hypothetical protein
MTLAQRYELLRNAPTDTPFVSTGFFMENCDLGSWFQLYTPAPSAFNVNLIPSPMFGTADPIWGGLTIRLGGDFVRGEIYLGWSFNESASIIRYRDFHLGFAKANRIEVNVRPRFAASDSQLTGPTGWVNLGNFRNWYYTGDFLELIMEFRSLDGAFANVSRFVTLRNTGRDRN